MRLRMSREGEQGNMNLLCFITVFALQVESGAGASLASPPAQAGRWPDRAEAAARLFIDANAQQLANSIQRIAHPEGKRPELLANRDISQLGDRILVKVAVSWGGSSTRGSYITWIAWEFSEKSHVHAKVTGDSAPTKVTSRNAALLDDHFREKVYPSISFGIRATAP